MRKKIQTTLLTSVKSALLGLALVSAGSVFGQYNTTDVIQNSQNCFPGMNNAMVLEVQISMFGPGTLNSIAFNTNGTGSVSNIENAKLYYTNAGSFATPLQTGNQVGSTVNSPNGAFSFTGLNMNLGGGTHHFFLTYDLPYSATVGDSVDAECVNVVVDNNTQVPFVTAPIGVRNIVTNIAFDYCTYPALVIGNYNIGISVFNSTDTNYIQPIVGSGNVFKNDITLNLIKDSDYEFHYKGGSGNPQREKIYLDINNDGFYEESEVVYEHTNPGATNNLDVYASVFVDCSLEPGVRRARIACDFYSYIPYACGTSTYGNAWELMVNVQDAPAPVASFDAPTSAYRGAYVDYINTSSGLGYNYDWDYTNDGTYDETAENGRAQYNTNGSRTVKMRMSRMICGQPSADSVTRTVNIIEPLGVPTSEFIADRNITNQTLVVTFKDLSNNGANKWEWEITPETVNGNVAYIYVNGTDATSQNPQVIFAELGVYNVTLTSENILGVGSTIAKASYIRNINIEDICPTRTTSDEAGFLADEAGVFANYPDPGANGKLCGFLIQPSCAASIDFTFLEFDMSSFQVNGCFIPGSNPQVLQPSDNIRIYDGTDNTGTPLHVAAGFPNGFTNLPGNLPLPALPPTVTATSGSMYIEYMINCSFNGKGFLGEWSSTPRALPAPSASFTGPDTVYINAPYIFTNTTTGTYDEVAWDFENDGLNDFGGVDANITFTTPGVQTVKMTAARCGNNTSFTKSVVVLAHTQAPDANFSAARTSLIVLDTIRLMDISAHGPTAWKWTITPSADIEWVNGSTSTSRNPYVKFNKTGSYEVKLWVSNPMGQDSLVRSSYIGVFTYCEPTVINQSDDIGISSVTIGSFTKTSVAGATNYTRYLDNIDVQQGATYNITIGRTTNFNNVNYKVWIDFNKNGSFSDPGEEVMYQGPTPALTASGSFRIPRNAQSGLTRMRIGASAEGNANNPCGPNQFGEFEDYNVTIGRDVTKPVISLNGNPIIGIEQGFPYLDLGATAMDNADGDITANIVSRNNVNSNVLGEYWVSYNVTDSSGNVADSVIRRVIVQPDNSGPIITLNGGDTIWHDVNTAFTDPGATALDYVDGVIGTINVSGAVNSNVLGTYYLTYSATDLQGNPSSTQRVVIVGDYIAPVMTLNGSDPMTVEYGTPYVDPGVSVSDNFYTNLVYTVTGSVNTGVMGSYILTYNVKDPSGNVASALTRVVNVEDNTPPTVQLFGGDTVIVPVFQKFADMGSVVTDNHTRGLFATVSGTVNANVTGTYTLTYSATDSSGNTGTATRIVLVVDTEAPVIVLKGSALIQISRFSAVPDPGVIIQDNYNTDAELQADLVITDNVVTDVEGLYDYCYQVADKSGNLSAQVCRLVEVGAANPNSLTELNAGNVQVYPNPARENFTITLGENVVVDAIRIYSSTGALVKELSVKAGDRNIVADLDGEAPGIYHVVVNANGKTYSTKLSYIR